MSKKFCKVDKKWCKFLKRGICNFCNTKLVFVNRCPRLRLIETTRLYELMKVVNFSSVFTYIYNWYESQRGNSKLYYYVFYKCCLMRPKKHNLTDLFINIELSEECGIPSVSGVKIINKDNISYGLEFFKWNDWVSMFITKETLDNFSPEEIVAACLYEMTFYGFNEDVIQEYLTKLGKVK